MQYIYKILNKINGKYYVGRTERLQSRWNEHMKMLESNKHHSKHFQNAYNKYPKDCWEWIIHKEFNTGDAKEDLKLAIEVEQSIIDDLLPTNDIYNTSYSAINGVLKGESHPYYGKHPSEWIGENYLEIMKANGERMKGENNHFYGKAHSEETKAILREKCPNYGEDNGFYGKTHSDETKRMIGEKASIRYKGEGNPFYGKSHTEETKRKISEANKGKTRVFTEEHKMNMRKNNASSTPIIIDGIEYVSITEAGRQLGMNRKLIAKRVKSEDYQNYTYKNK